MGCVYSRGTRKVAKGDSLSFSEMIGGGGGDFGVHEKKATFYDSGELRLTTAKAGASKVPEMSSVLGRAGVVGLEKAVEVLDTLGSSMVNLNLSSGFMSGMAYRGNKISILAFEVANTIAKGASLMRSLSEENVQILKKEILQSVGVQRLVSTDTKELLSIAAADKREEFNVFVREVVRFGDLCKDPEWHNLDRYFQKLDSEFTPHQQLNEEAETTMQQLINSAQHTSELYHELHALDRFEQDYRRKLQEGESLPSGRRGESLMILHTELKHQRKLVKSLKKKSLWSRNLEEVVEKLVDIVTFLHKEILEAFGHTGNSIVDSKTDPTHRRLGVSGLALHYANVINQIDNIVSRPISLPPNTRDTLYQSLPIDVKAALRSRLQSFHVNEELTVAQIKAEMQKTLDWIVPMADNTIRAHQGFGWVGEWANMGTELSKKPLQQYNVMRIQTLHHADKEKTDEYILELAIWLHHLVSQVKNRGYGFKTFKPVRSPSQKGTLLPLETKQNLSPACNDKTRIVFQLSEEDREMLECIDSKRLVLGRSRSHGFLPRKEERSRRRWGVSRSSGNSPTKEFNTGMDYQFEPMKNLDVMDGLDRREPPFPVVSFYA